MDTRASSSASERVAADAATDVLATARWENEGGATGGETRPESFFAVMFNWFRPAKRPRRGDGARVAERHAAPAKRGVK